MPATASAGDRQRVADIVTCLRTHYPDAKCSLTFTSPFELLVATILAAQCTDERVNATTKNLFQKYHTPQDYADAALEELEQDLKSINFYRNKAKNIQAMARMVIATYGGSVPQTMNELLTLPGVARKTANVVMGDGLGIVEGIVVDTHVGRISRRLGLTTSEDPPQVEQDLMQLVDKADWLPFSHLLIYHGRAICKSQKPQCGECFLKDLCPTGQQASAM